MSDSWKTRFNELFRETSWYPDNWEPIEDFIDECLNEQKASIAQELATQRQELLEDLKRFCDDSGIHCQNSEMMLDYLNSLSKETK